MHPTSRCTSSPAPRTLAVWVRPAFLPWLPLWPTLSSLPRENEFADCRSIQPLLLRLRGRPLEAQCWKLWFRRFDTRMVISKGWRSSRLANSGISWECETLALVHSWCTLACKWDHSVQLTACQVTQSKRNVVSTNRAGRFSKPPPSAASPPWDLAATTVLETVVPKGGRLLPDCASTGSNRDHFLQADFPILIRTMPNRTTSESPTCRKVCLVSFTSRENTASNRTQYPAGSAE